MSVSARSNMSKFSLGLFHCYSKISLAKWPFIHPLLSNYKNKSAKHCGLIFFFYVLGYHHCIKDSFTEVETFSTVKKQMSRMSHGELCDLHFVIIWYIIFAGFNRAGVFYSKRQLRQLDRPGTWTHDHISCNTKAQQLSLIQCNHSEESVQK